MPIDTARERGAALLDGAVVIPDGSIDTADRAVLVGEFFVLITDAQRAEVQSARLLWLYDYDDAQTMTLHELINLEIDDRLQDSETLRFTIAADDPKADFVLLDTLVRYRQLPGGFPRFWRITRREPGRSGTRAVIDVEAEGRWTELASRVIPGSFVLTDKTPAAGLDLILLHRDYGWTVGTVDAPPFAWYGIDKTDATILDMLRDWAKVTGCELVFDTAAMTVSLVASQGEENDLGFRYGWNLSGITRRETPPAVTVLYAYGRNGLTISGINPSGNEHIEDFSYYTAQGLTVDEARTLFTREQIWKDDSFISDEPLYDAAVARLAELAQPIAAYEGKVLDLGGAGLPGHVSIGDTVPVRDTTLGISVRTRVVRYVHRPLRPHDNEIELAYLQGRPADTSTDSRATNQGEDWLLFLTESEADRVINQNLSILGDIGLQFSKGQAIHHFDAQGTATGTGTLRVTFYDEVGNATIGPIIDIPFSAGPVHVPATFALDELDGKYLFSVRVQVVSGTGSISFPTGSAKYSILCKGGLGVTVPPEENSITFSYNGTFAAGTNGSVQTWDVPPDVTEIVIDCYGAQGQNQLGGAGGGGGRIRARVPVTAGETLNVFVGGNPRTIGPGGGYNGGGDGGGSAVTACGGGGGGASDVRRDPYALADRLVVAGGGGGAGSYGGPGSANYGPGGAGGYPDGEEGFDRIGGGPGHDGIDGKGGTQSAGGAAGTNGAGDAGTAGTLGQGGAGGRVGGTGGVYSGGGGAGLYGGGGAAHTGSSWGAGGGGGSSGAPTLADLPDGRDAIATEILAENGVQTGHGKVVISWDTPS